MELDDSSSAEGQPSDRAQAEQSRERFLVARFQARLAYVLDNFRVCRSLMAGRRSLNESIGDLRTAQRPRARRANRARLDPQIEFVFAWKLREQGIDEPNPAQVSLIAKELASSLKMPRGRPADVVLTHHVEGLVLLYEETCGRPSVLQSQVLDDEYCPRLKAGLGTTLLKMIQSVDSTVTETAVANIIRRMPRPGSPGRKRFRDYFPLADHRGVAPELVPGIEATAVGVIWPIYCS